MIDEFITKVGNYIRDTLSGFFNLDWIPEVWFWWWWLFLFGLLCAAIIFFFGWSKIVRIVTSMAFLFAAIFVAGGHYMARRMNAKKEKVAASERERQAAARARPQTPHANTPWKWPWEN